MLNQTITIQNKLGLHTRAAAKLVAAANKFESKIEFIRNEQPINCKSIMSLILLGAKKGTELNLVITGGDELEACDTITTLINNKFGEAD